MGTVIDMSELTTKQRSFTLSELLKTDFPPLTWYVENILAGGLTLLWGSSKSGKSILALHLLLAIAQGEDALGTFKSQESGVLLISLEDGPRRLQTRLQGANAPPLENFYIYTDWERGDEGNSSLISYLDANPNIQVVVIDTLGLFSKLRDSNDYMETISVMEKYKSIADEHDIAIILIHHSKKPSGHPGADMVHTALGSTGLVAAPDHLIFLERTPAGPTDAVLHFRSKDGDPADLALQFDQDIRGWSFVDKAEDLAGTKERQEILDVLRKNGQMTTGEIAEALGKKKPAVSNLLGRLIEKGQVRKIDYGVYSLPQPPCETGERVKVEEVFEDLDSQIHNFHGATPASSDDKFIERQNDIPELEIF